MGKIFVDFLDLAQFSFTTSESELDYYHQKVNVRVASSCERRKKISEKLAIDGKSPASHTKAKFRQLC